jgi:hypothetical protein
MAGGARLTNDIGSDVMSIVVICKHCGQDIIVEQRLGPGETYLCQSCWQRASALLHSILPRRKMIRHPLETGSCASSPSI